MAFTQNDDLNIIQASDSATVSAGAGNDTYIVSPATIGAGQQVTITDTEGTNTLQLVGGLSITSSQVANDALLLTLSNGAVVTLLSASAFNFNVGGNVLAGIAGTDKDYATFAQEDLGVTVPAEGEAAVDGGAATIGGETPTEPTEDQTFTLTNAIDNLEGGSGNDTFIGDNTSANAGDTLNGGEGTDTLKLYNSVSLGNLTSIENVEIHGHSGNVNTSNNADIVSVSMIDQTLAATDTPTYTLSGAQTLTIDNVKDSDADNTDGVEVNAAASVTEQTINLDAAGDAATAGLDLNVDINGTGVATLNVDSSNNASRVSLENSGTAVRTLNISGDAALTVETNAAANVGAAVTAINITNTAGASVVSSAATNTTAGLNITAAAGDDTVVLAQAAGANALTNNVAVDLGAGDDTLAITNLTAATDIQDGASFVAGEGNDTLNIVNGAVLNATTGALFSGFEVLDLSNAAASTFDAAHLEANNSINLLKVTQATAAAVTVNNLAETASVELNAALGGALTINQKDAGAGSPDDVLDVLVDARAAITTGSNIDINDIETVNLTVQGTGSTTTQTHTISQLTADEATKVTINASDANVTIADLEADSAVLVDASASAQDVSITTGADTFTATAGVAFKGGAGDDTIVLTGADTSAAAATDLDFVVTGNGGADAITLAAGGTGVDHVVYAAQSDSTATEFDAIVNFVTTEDKIDLKAFGFDGNFDDALTTKTTGISVNANGDVEVTSAASVNFFADGGNVDRAVAIFDDGTDTYAFVDVNKDGDFNAADDSVIELTGLTGATVPVLADFVFA